MDQPQSDMPSAPGTEASIGRRTFHHLLKSKTNGRVLSIEQINEGIAEACVAANISESIPPSGLPTISPSRGEIDPE